MPLATVNKGGRVVTAEGWVIQGRGGGAKYNLQEQHLRLVAYFFANDPPEVCVEDEYYNSGKWLLSTFLSSVLIRHPSVREIQESGC